MAFVGREQKFRGIQYHKPTVRLPRQIIEYGQDALLLKWEQRIDPSISKGVHAYATQMWEHPATLESVAAYCSLLVRFDHKKTTAYRFKEWIYAQQPLESSRKGKRHRLPVVYGGEFGPDLAEVALQLELSEQAVIELHQATTYDVYQLGYQPGFAFLGQTDEQLNVNRRENPRTRVEPGSVGLAGRQTGIYPSASPGGWQLIGRCPALLWDATQETPNRLLPGDKVKFYAINAADWDKTAKKTARWKD